MISFAEIIPELEQLLPTTAATSTYLGHTSQRAGVADETLAEHVHLVHEYFGRLAEAHGLEAVVDKLIAGLFAPYKLSSERFAEVGAHAKKLFVAALAFHDFGKTNPNYQRQSLSNPKWSQQERPVPFYPAKGHSELGAFLYVHYFLPYALAQPERGVKALLMQLTFGLSYSICQHHAKGQFELTDYAKRKMQQWYQSGWFSQVKYFVELYGFDVRPQPMKRWHKWTREVLQLVELANPAPYALHSFIKLNFSLLTASDYLATSDYMNQAPLEEFGIISEALRRKIVTKAKTSVDYNAAIFAAAAAADFKLSFPTARTNDNLNLLRKEMAVEALRTLDRYPDDRIYYLEAPTGGGKTNISMLIAARLLERDHSLNKLLYVFPFTTLATQTLGALRKVYGLEAHEVAEIHSKASYQSVEVERERTEVDANYGSEQEDHLRYLFFHFPIALVTHVRFFNWLTTHWKEPNYVYHRLTGSVVILDELQAYDPKHWAKVARYLDHFGRHFNCRFVIMSATLPKLDALLPQEVRGAFSFRELIPDAQRYLRNPNFAGRVQFEFDLLYNERGKRRTISLKDLSGHVREQAENYRRRAGQSGVFVIVEFIFKRSAARFQWLFAQDDYFDEIHLLSGTILEPQRRLIINRLKRAETRSRRVLLITTQVVEAGVDLDMDIGFKHVSLPDSDEQLAGRINRNVKKKGCRLWLFFSGDDPKVIYGNDFRYQRLAEKRNENAVGHRQLHESLLRDKAFDELYGSVFGFIDGLEDMPGVKDINTYERHLKELDLVKAHEEFQLIEGRNETAFVPLRIPLAVPGSDSEAIDPLFTADELRFLDRLGVDVAGDTLDGAQVFAAYLTVIHPPEMEGEKRKRDFIRDQNNYRRLAAILSRFTFSLMSTENLQRRLISFCDMKKSGYGYWYLQHYDRVYSLADGLDQDQFDAGVDTIM